MNLTLFNFFFQYLKDKEKGKYSMISGKKIKMKVKKSKKDKQASSIFFFTDANMSFYAALHKFFLLLTDG